MVGVRNADHGAAGRPGLLDRDVHGHDPGNLPKTVSGIQQTAGGRLLGKPHVRVEFHDAGANALKVGAEPRDPMGGDAAQVGIDQRIGDGRRRLRPHAGGLEDVFDEASQRPGVEDDMI